MKRWSIVALLILIASFGARADMFVDRSIVIFESGGQPREDVKVTNNGEDVMYVEVEVLAVRNPGAENEERVKISDPNELKLLATPSKLILPAGGQKLIRIVNLQARNDTERVYRINVTPIVPPLEEETSQLRIVVAYQILTIVQPDDPSTELVTKRSGTAISFENTGNSNILLSEGKQCHPDNQDQCQELGSQRLYAGNTWVQELTWDAPVTYSVRTFDGIKTEVFP
jgi:P pilus assembly chaperone PapD